MKPLLRQSSHRKAKSAAKDKIASQFLVENLDDNEWSYNTNPDAFENNGRESEGRRVLFSSCDNIKEIVSPSSDAVKPTLTTTSVDRIVSNRAEQGKENNSPPVGNLGDETVVLLGQALRLNLNVEKHSPVGLVGPCAGLFTPPNESPKSYKRQMDQIVRQLPEEVGNRGNLRIERQCLMHEVVRQLTREFVKRDILRNERAFWMGEMARVLEQIDVEYFGPDWDRWDLQNEQAFWRGEMARVLEQVDVEFFGPYWDDWDDLCS
jgi:hypothetical protein